MPPLLRDPAATKSFLARELERLTDADPQILADYILALLRHDKPAEELRSLCQRNLQDFLHDKTGAFVDRLMAFLSSDRDYHQQEQSHNQQHGQQQQPYYYDTSSMAKRGRRHPAPYRTTRSTARTRLIVERIPPELCNVAVVSSFFQKFGPLVNVRVIPEEARALLQFERPEDAQRAHDAPEAILDNRFVKLFWSESARTAEHQPETTMPPRQPHPNVVVDEAKRQEAQRSLLTLQHQQQNLLLRYIDQQKELMAKLQDAQPAEQEAILAGIREIDGLVEGVRASIASLEQKLAELQPQQRKPRRKPTVIPTAIPPSARKLDMRPTALAFTLGADAEGKRPFNEASLRAFLQTFGDVRALQFGESDGTVVVQYALRHEAERALVGINKAEFEKSGPIQWHQAITMHASPNTAAALLEDVPMDDGSLDDPPVEVSTPAVAASPSHVNQAFPSPATTLSPPHQ